METYGRWLFNPVSLSAVWFVVRSGKVDDSLD